MTHDHHDHGHHDHGSHNHRSHEHHDHEHTHGGHSYATVDAPAEELAECPVMPGSMVVKAEAEAAGLVREHEGKTYHLCCDACGPMFDSDPNKYAAV